MFRAMTDKLPPAPGLMIAAPRSGAGKTTVTLGLLRALARKGRHPISLKCGPDYIDPAFHAAATGKPSRNIDSWAMRAALLDHLITTARQTSQLVVCEALMGLFDGVKHQGTVGNGSSADIAARTGWPVLLVLDISGQAQSAAATALGFARYRQDVTVAGVVLNRVGSERHRKLTTEAIESLGLPVVGALPKFAEIALPERHLGLVQPSELDGLMAALDRLADWVSQHVDLAQIERLAAPGHLLTRSQSMALSMAQPMAQPAALKPQGLNPQELKPPGQRIALAKDTAFSFLYPHLLDAWRMAGADIQTFSPLNDEAPDMSCDVCWLPGGYPELHAGQLAGNEAFFTGLRDFAKTKPVHGECGGYMVLGKALVDAAGTAHQMAGLLSHVTSFAKRKMNLGYRRARVVADFPLGAKGQHLTGHEFHYSSVIEAGNEAPLVALEDANGSKLPQTGGKRGFVSGTYFHIIDRLDGS